MLLNELQSFNAMSEDGFATQESGHGDQFGAGQYGSTPVVNFLNRRRIRNWLSVFWGTFVRSNFTDRGGLISLINRFIRIGAKVFCKFTVNFNSVLKLHPSLVVNLFPFVERQIPEFWVSVVNHEVLKHGFFFDTNKRVDSVFQVPHHKLFVLKNPFRIRVKTCVTFWRNHIDKLRSTSKRMTCSFEGLTCYEIVHRLVLDFLYQDLSCLLFSE